MEMICHPHTLAAFIAGEGAPSTQLGPRAVRMFWRREKSFSLLGFKPQTVPLTA